MKIKNESCCPIGWMTQRRYGQLAKTQARKAPRKPTQLKTTRASGSQNSRNIRRAQRA
jgi:hypothetical protein